MSFFPEVSLPPMCWAFSLEACPKRESLSLSPPSPLPGEWFCSRLNPTPGPLLRTGSQLEVQLLSLVPRVVRCACLFPLPGSGGELSLLPPAVPGVGFVLATAPGRGHRSLLVFSPQAKCASSSHVV